MDAVQQANSGHPGAPMAFAPVAYTLWQKFMNYDPAAPTSCGLYRVVMNENGKAGALSLVAAFARGDEPGPLAVGSSGAAYVVLRAAGSIVAIAPTGMESWRIAAPGSGPIPLDSPSALALTAGQLLVANQGSGTDASHWAVLAVSVNDGARS